MVLVDTTIWSLALRRRSQDLNDLERARVARWAALIESGRAALIGPIRQEILSGIRISAHFDGIRAQLDSFRYLTVLQVDYDEAARFFNQCRARGITAGDVDMLICAVAARWSIPVFTSDKDFPRYAKHLPIRLLEDE